MKWGSLPLSKPTLPAGSPSPRQCYSRERLASPRPAAGEEGDVGPAVHHVYEVRGAAGMEGGARMNDREGGASMSDRWLGPA